ncbi:MAG: hypothetical protein R3313_01640 [Candidatus Saccharimonadales bacterium]|nr:hypothetical protein [Candidatus Saccharimonadales bacterium]
MYQICVSGAAKGKSVEEGKELAIAAGKALAQAGCAVLTGATTGLPHYAAMGAKEEGAQSIGISPAASKVEHVKKYQLPVACYDVILYTGLHYVGRDSLLVSSSDAVISIGGRLGTLHEFATAMEMDTPVGFIMGAGGVSTEIRDILKAAGKRKHKNVIFDADPKRLVKRLIKLLDAIYADDIEIYRKAAHCDIRDKILAK